MVRKLLILLDEHAPPVLLLYRHLLPILASDDQIPIADEKGLDAMEQTIQLAQLLPESRVHHRKLCRENALPEPANPEN